MQIIRDARDMIVNVYEFRITGDTDGNTQR